MRLVLQPLLPHHAINPSDTRSEWLWKYLKLIRCIRAYVHVYKHGGLTMVIIHHMLLLFT